MGTLEVTNSTFVFNQADANGDGSGIGGAMYLASSSSFATPVLNNTVVAGNLRGVAGGDVPDDVFGMFDSASSHNLIGDTTTSGGLVHAGNGNIVGNDGIGTLDITTVLDPSLADNGGLTLTHALLPDGLAVDAGNNALAVDAGGNPLKYDQRGDGFPRIVDATVDIGAFELPPQPQIIDIDVKPGSDSNPVNLASQGRIAIALFTTDDFDAANVDVSSVIWAGAGVAQKNNGDYFSALEDVDGDGDLDMVLHFNIQETSLAEIYSQLLLDDEDDDDILDSTRQEATVSLTGETTDGTQFLGSGDVDLFFAGRALRDFLNELFDDE